MTAPITELEQLATWIEAHMRLKDVTLRSWLCSCRDFSDEEFPAWLRNVMNIVASRRSWRLAEKLLANGGCWILSLRSRCYPQRLASALGELAPPLLYCRGNLELFRQPQFAIIGTRRPSALGRKAARNYAKLLAQHRWVVVSGNARGTDAIAHEEALTSGGATMVFPPTSLDAFEPAFHWNETWDRCLVASRYVPGSEIAAWNFLGRNQLVAAMCRGALVAETGVRGGTLDTVGHLRRLRRPIFVAQLPPDAKHFRAYELLRASGACPVPLEPSQDFLQQLLVSLPGDTPCEETTKPPLDLFGESSPR
ncbi:MAG: DNA-processing protein DprA [Candidatus Sumerlaeaceae bacterium]